MSVCFCAGVCLFLTQVGVVDSVEAVRFTGSRAFRGRQLAGIVATRAGQPLDERKLDSDVRALELFYRDNGFRDARAGRRVARGRRKFVVTFNMVEGRRMRVGAVSIAGNRQHGDGALLRLIPARAGADFTAEMLAGSVQAVRNRYLNTGYPFVEVDADWRFADTLADLEIEIAEGPRCHLGDLRVRGNQTVRTATILRAAELRRGELFSQQRLREAQRRLYATRLFQRVLFNVLRADTVQEPEVPSESVAIRFDVVEQPHRAFSFGGGLETPPLRLLVAAGWEYANVFNRGHQYDVGAEYSPDFAGSFRTSLDMHYRVPYLILTRIDFHTHPFFYIDRVDTLTRREYGIETGLARNLARYLSVGLFNRLRLVADTSSGVTNALALNAQYDSRDDFFDPGHGFYLRPVAELAGGPLGGDNDFYRLTAEARAFQAIGAGFVVAGRVLIGRCFPYGRTGQIPYYEAFTLGGRNSLRGYGDKSLGPDSVGAERFGPMAANTNVELRTPYLLGWVGLVGFFDSGEVAGLDTGFTGADYQYSAGAGIRVRTPIGPVRLDWGRRLKDPEPQDKGKLYLGLLHAF